VDLVSNPLPLAIPFAPTPGGFGPDIAGEAVCARGGGGGGGAGLAASSPACKLLLQLKHSLLFHNAYLLIDPSFEILIVVERALLA
jgi:hypothetical protein